MTDVIVQHLLTDEKGDLVAVLNILSFYHGFV